MAVPCWCKYALTDVLTAFGPSLWNCDRNVNCMQLRLTLYECIQHELDIAIFLERILLFDTEQVG